MQMKYENSDNLRFSTAQVASRLGIHRDTLLRWLRKGLFNEPARDHRGWRVFSNHDIDNISRVIQQDVRPPTEIRDQRLDYLSSIGWDFHGAKTNYLTHALHPYPAKFIPQIPNALIQELSSVGETVLDIFAGSGTTLVEALTLKRNAIGIDANPLSALISNAKTTPLATHELVELRDLTQRAVGYALALESDNPDMFGGIEFSSDAPKPNSDAIKFWFEPFVANELAEILSWFNQLSSVQCQNLAKTAFSSIVVAVSKQDSDTRYVRREKSLSPGDTFNKFARALTKAVKAAEELGDVVEERFKCNIIESNILDAPSIEPVDLLVCSPPYPNAYSYHLYHMTRMVWLSLDQPKFKKQEIGSHRKYSSKGPNAATVDTFKSEMWKIFSWMKSALKKDRYACFVVGNSTLKGESIDNASLISSVARELGFVEVERISRNLQSTKKSFNPKIGKIRDEKILILQNMS